MGGATMMEQKTVIPSPCTGTGAAEEPAVPLKETQTGLNGQSAF